LATGTDSPVSAASATCSCTASSRRASAATASPAASSSRSPGTSSRASAAPARGRRAARAPQPSQLAQRRHRALGAAFLETADQRVDHHHGQDHRRVAQVTQRHRQHRGDEEDGDQRALELVQQDAPQRPRRRLRQHVAHRISQA
jgi:hypothetical protein